MLGLDCIRYPSARAVLAAGYRFVWGYLSTPGNPKNITRAKVQEYVAAGIAVPLIFETTAARAGQGFPAGVADAHSGVAQQANLGIPASRPIHYAVDYDATGPAVVPYFQGLASVPGDDSAYGGFKVVSWLLDQRLIHDAWQTAAWSGGKRDPRIAVFQRIGTVYVDGIACDVDEALVADFGQYPVEDTMPLSQADIDAFVAAMRNRVLAADDWRFDGRNPIDMLKQILGSEDQQSQILATLSDDEVNIIAAVRAAQASPVDVSALTAALAPALAPLIKAGATPDQVKTAVREVFASAGKTDGNGGL